MKQVDLSVQLLGHYGGDLEHAGAAWTSTTRDLSPERLARLPAFLKRLADEGHHTPFERSTLHFLVETDIASHIHLLKHRIGVGMNAESARYKEKVEDKAYIPSDFILDWDVALQQHVANSYRLYHQCIREMTGSGMDRTRAKEAARYFLPYATTITTDVYFNWRSFAMFQEKRNFGKTGRPQREIQRIAIRMLNEVKAIPGNPFQHTIAAFGF